MQTLKCRNCGKNLSPWDGSFCDGCWKTLRLPTAGETRAHPTSYSEAESARRPPPLNQTGSHDRTREAVRL